MNLQGHQGRHGSVRAAHGSRAGHAPCAQRVRSSNRARMRASPLSASRGSIAWSPWSGYASLCLDLKHALLASMQLGCTPARTMLLDHPGPAPPNSTRQSDRLIERVSGFYRRFQKLTAPITAIWKILRLVPQALNVESGICDRTALETDVHRVQLAHIESNSRGRVHRLLHRQLRSQRTPSPRTWGEPSQDAQTRRRCHHGPRQPRSLRAVPRAHPVPRLWRS